MGNNFTGYAVCIKTSEDMKDVFKVGKRYYFKNNISSKKGYQIMSGFDKNGNLVMPFCKYDLIFKLWVRPKKEKR